MGSFMRNFRRTRVVNRFSAISSSFKAEFAGQVQTKPKINLTLSTILSEATEAEESSWLESLLEIWHQGAMVFNAASDVTQTTEFTEKTLEKYFSNAEKDQNGVPIELANWMMLYKFSGKKTGIEMTNEPFVVDNGGNELRIRLIVDNNSKSKTLLLRETVQMQPENLMSLGLTKREAEVLFLIAKGKTNPEIGILLEISTRTVQKHVEHIYIKLGVETRTAAMLRVNELNLSLGDQDIGVAEK